MKSSREADSTTAVGEGDSETSTYPVRGDTHTTTVSDTSTQSPPGGVVEGSEGGGSHSGLSVFAIAGMYSQYSALLFETLLSAGFINMNRFMMFKTWVQRTLA